MPVWKLVTIATLLSLAACGKEETPTATGTASNTTTTRPLTLPATQPEDAVDGQDFIETVKRGQLAMLKEMLADSPAVAKYRNEKDGATPLHYTPTRVIAALLVDHGADIAARDKANNSPLRSAVDRDCWDVVKYLQEQGAKEEDVGFACAVGDLTRVKELVEKNPQAALARTRQDDALPGNATPLHLAAFYGRNDVAEYLLAHGADVNAQGAFAATEPLENAAWRGYADVVETLIAHGADLEAKDTRFGRTALGWAVVRGRKAAVEVLVKHHANVTAVMLQDALDERQKLKSQETDRIAEFDGIIETLKGAAAKTK